MKPSTLAWYNRGVLNNRFVYWFGEWILENFPPILGYSLTRGFAEGVYLTRPAVRRQMRANVRHVLSRTSPELTADELDRRAFRITHRIFVNRGRMYADHSLLTGHRSERGLARHEGFGGWAEFSRHVAAGRGAILASAHLGNWQEGAVLASRRLPPGRRVRTVLYGNARATRVQRGLARRGNLETTYVLGPDPMNALEVIRGLRRGEVVAMLADIPFDSRWIEIPFFGRPARLPIGPFRIARLAGTPLWPAYCVWKGPREYVGHVEEPIEVAGPDPDEAERAAAAKLAAVYERWVARHLELWFNFTPVWTST